MANLTAQRDTPRMISQYDGVGYAPMLVGGIVFKGGLVKMGTAGTATRGGGAIATGNKTLGRAKYTINPAVAGDIIEYETGIFLFANAGAVVAASRGLVCYADDDQTVSLTATNMVAGRVFDVTPAGVWVIVDGGISNTAVVAT
jgi:hypothetical protein